ncbi:MAG TPA: hypothetical protein VGL61_18485 [Kofleriaceae bacterium]
MENPGALDELADDLPADDVLLDHTLDFRPVHPIIQSRRAPRPRHGRKAGAEDRCSVVRHLAHEHVRALRAAAEAALPHELDTPARLVRRERRLEDLVELCGRAAIAALRPATDHDLEAALHAYTSVTVESRGVNLDVFRLIRGQRLAQDRDEAGLRARIGGNGRE